MEPITISGLGLPVLVALTVAALKRVKLVTNGDQARIAALGSALGYAGIWIAVQFYPAAAPAVGTIVMGLWSALLAAAGFEAQEALRAKGDG